MGLSHSPKIVTDGLVFAYDMNNGKSNVGAPTTNTLPSPSINGYPTIGNGWGTYNTNQYGSGTYFSIGTVASVSGNIVTMTAPHSLRTYDVMQPQTTGGGVTAGTNYFIKKLSDTTFSLHAYNSSQDGSQGYVNPATGMFKVHDSIALNQQIAINATSFPTMWWGYPHLPNSGLVKEIISKGFNGIPGRASTDCIRLHYIRNVGLDGMAYGVDGVVTAGSAHTVSFWAKAASASAVGVTNSYQIYNHGVTSPYNPSWSFTLGALNEWKKYSFTFTPNNPYCISYWFPGTGNMKYDIANIQFEIGSVANNFVAGTRSNTQALIDLTGSNTITASSLTYASDGTFSFNGSSNYIDINNTSIVSGTNAFTVDAFYTTAGSTSDEIFGNYGTGYTSGNLWISGRYGVYINGAVYFPGSPLSAGTYHLSVTRDSSGNVVLYKNGIQVNTGVLAASIPSNINFRIGADVNGAGEPFTGKIYNVKVYNRALSAAEVKQNFNALKERFFGYQRLTYIGSSNVTITNNGTEEVTMFKTASANAWDSHVYCPEAFTAPCTIEFTKNADAYDNGASYAMIGWNTDPTTDQSYSSLDHAAYPFITSTYYVYSNGSQTHYSGTWDPNKRFYVVYDTDGYIRHYNGSTLLYTGNEGTGQTVYVDSSFYSLNATYSGFTNVKVCRKSWNGTSYV